MYDLKRVALQVLREPSLRGKLDKSLQEAARKEALFVAQGKPNKLQAMLEEQGKRDGRPFSVVARVILAGVRCSYMQGPASQEDWEAAAADYFREKNPRELMRLNARQNERIAMIDRIRAAARGPMRSNADAMVDDIKEGAWE